MNTRSITSIFFIGLIMFFSCDIIEEPYKKDNIIISSDRKVLLEDYTGHQCPNCPAAGEIVKDILGLYKDNVVVIAVHAGPLAKLLVPPFTYDFTTETGDAWNSNFEIATVGYPSGLINRKERSGSRIIAPNSWAAMVAEQISLPTEADIELDVQYDTATRQIQVATTTNIASPKHGVAYFLTVVLTEDSIVKPQKTTPSEGNVIMDYIHMHVLRLSVTPGYWGVPVNGNIIEQKTFNYTLDAGSDIVPANCNIVAFLTNCSREVLQAEEVRLIP